MRDALEKKRRHEPEEADDVSGYFLVSIGFDEVVVCLGSRACEKRSGKMETKGKTWMQVTPKNLAAKKTRFRGSEMGGGHVQPADDAGHDDGAEDSAE